MLPPWGEKKKSPITSSSSIHIMVVPPSSRARRWVEASWKSFLFLLPPFVASLIYRYSRLPGVARGGARVIFVTFAGADCGTGRDDFSRQWAWILMPRRLLDQPCIYIPRRGSLSLARTRRAHVPGSLMASAYAVASRRSHPRHEQPPTGETGTSRTCWWGYPRSVSWHEVGTRGPLTCLVSARFTTSSAKLPDDFHEPKARKPGHFASPSGISLYASFGFVVTSRWLSRRGSWCFI